MEALEDLGDGMEVLGVMSVLANAAKPNNSTRGPFSAEIGSDEKGVLQMRSCQSLVCHDPASPWAKYMGEHNYMYLNKKVEKHIVLRLLEEWFDNDPLPVLKLYIIEVPSKVIMA
jgi:hypothetical protein